jgi:hypothetical protein
MKNLHQSELSVQRGRTHRPVAVVELHEPLQSQTVVSLGLETKDYSSFKSRLAQAKKKLLAEILADLFPKMAEKKDLPQVHYQQPRLRHLFNGIA